MNIIINCYNCRKEFFAVITSLKFICRCPHCFKLNRVRTIVDGKAKGEDHKDAKLATETY